MPRDRALVVNHEHWNASATETPDDSEALIVPSEHDGAHLRSATEACSADATGRPRTEMLDESHSSPISSETSASTQGHADECNLLRSFGAAGNDVEIEDDMST
jgi:hypothetical protein